jgi:hypothetical protein
VFSKWLLYVDLANFGYKKKDGKKKFKHLSIFFGCPTFEPYIKIWHIFFIFLYSPPPPCLLAQ